MNGRSSDGEKEEGNRGSCYESDLYKIITLAEFCVTPMIPIPLSLACGIKRPAIPASVILHGHVGLEIVLINSGAVFYVDGNGAYNRGEYYIIYILSYVFSLSYLMLVHQFLINRTQYLSISSIAQFKNPQRSLYFISFPKDFATAI